MKNPYINLPSQAYWKSGVVEANPFNFTNLYTKKWPIDSEMLIATAGSCFAQHISKGLRSFGFNVLDLEPAPTTLPSELHSKYQYSLYSARYGNIYTSRQLLQLAKEAFGIEMPSEIVWKKDNRFYDALRPGIEPNGLDSEAEVIFHRKHHLAKVKQLFLSMDLFIFTLGLTETWQDKSSGTVFPVAPGTIAGVYDELKYGFTNLSFTEIKNDLLAFGELVNSHRPGRLPLKILLTVSPVPLTATASGMHVLQATTYSKSVLRAVAGELKSNHHEYEYFPSYEIITNLANRSVFYEANLRSVRSEGVKVVMETFFKQHAPKGEIDKSANAVTTSSLNENLINDALACEEVLYEANK